jgi:hydrogenase maturation protease
VTERLEFSGGILVIGYGNTLRGDDGVGPKVARAITDLPLQNVHSLACHQLTPELAAQLSEAHSVIFVDASSEMLSGVQWRELEPAETAQIMVHAADPRTLLALARDVFGRCPRAWWLTVPIQNIDFGEELSPLARQGMETAIAKIQAFARGNRPG